MVKENMILNNEFQQHYNNNISYQNKDNNENYNKSEMNDSPYPIILIT